MRTLEALSWIIAVAGIAWWLLRPPPRRAHAGLVLGWIVVATAQMALEGARVHLIPSYVLGAGLAGAAAWRASRRTRAVLAAPAVVLAALGVALPAMFPVFRYDPPDGAHGIGTASYTLHDPTIDHDLAIQLWYPAAKNAAGRRAGITPRPDLLGVAYARVTGLPAPLFDHLRLIETNAIEGAPLDEGHARLPIVLFSHGPISGNRSQSIFQMEALASHGFVVVAIDHTGYSSLTVFSDGRVAPPDPGARWPVFADDAARALVRRWVTDTSRVIDYLEVLDRGDPRGLVTGRLDLERIGYLGASFGGSVVVDALITEPRIKAGVAEDGKPYFFERTLTDLRTPLLYFQSELPYIPVGDAQLAAWGVTPAGFAAARADHYARLDRLTASARGPFYDVRIRGTNHISFSDLHFLIRWPDRQLEDPRRSHRVINDYTVAFFERYLAGDASPLVDGRPAGPYPEVTVSARNIPERVARAD